MDAIMLAVAVHDEGEARLEPAVPERIRVEAGRPLRFRVSYRLADNARVREDARLWAHVEVDGQGPWEAEVEMRDRPILDDSRSGDLEFDVPALKRGTHTLQYTVHLETQDQDALLKEAPKAGQAHLAGQVEIQAV